VSEVAVFAKANVDRADCPTPGSVSRRQRSSNQWRLPRPA